jgi:pilus assembly protein CpaC
MATLSDALNVFLFRRDLNLMATIQAMQQKSVLEVLAEPNLLAMNGKAASFLAGGQFPYPTFQAGAGSVGAVTIQFREFGVRLNFTPTITPRGTIRLLVSPEVSALDFTSGLVVQGFNVPALTVRRVDTEIELASGQSFAIGGLIDNSFTETISKIPALGDLPILGKLFQSKSRTKENTELIIIVTPELVAPLAAGQPVTDINYPQPLLWPRTTTAEADVPAAEPPKNDAIPFETLLRSLRTAAGVQPAAPQAAQLPGSSPSSPPPASPAR